MDNEFYEGWLFPDPGTKHRDVLIDFLYSDYKLFPLWGSVSSGKTVSSSQAWAGLIKQTPKNYPFAMIGKTELTLEANVLDPLTDFLGSKDCYKRGNVAYIYGHKVRLYGANDAKSRSKIQGKSLYAWYGDEVTTWPEDFFMMALSRLRVGKAKAIMTMNPESKFHWFHKQVIERAALPEIRAKLYHFTMDDNPHLPEDYKAWISSMYVPGTVWYKRWIKGEWAAAEGAVFPFMTDDINDGFVLNTLPDDLTTWLVAIDYGIQHYTVFVLAGFSISMNKWVVVKEFFTKDKTNTVYASQFQREILEYRGGIQVLEINVDPGGGGLSLTRELQSQYPNLSVFSATKKDVSKELQELATALFTKKLCFYAPGCKRGLEQLINYTWDDRAKAKGRDEPLKQNDDFVDALRYLWQICLRYS